MLRHSLTNRFFSAHAQPEVVLIRWAAVFTFIAVVAGALNFTTAPAEAVARILFFFAFILSLTLFVLGMAAKRK